MRREVKEKVCRWLSFNGILSKSQREQESREINKKSLIRVREITGTKMNKTSDLCV